MLQVVGELEVFDWSPEVDLVKGLLLPSRSQVVVDYMAAARRRASARSRLFVGAVVEGSGLGRKIWLPSSATIPSSRPSSRQLLTPAPGRPTTTR
jgi:hypothetical protein